MRKMFSDSILDLRKCPNRKLHESESACFPVGVLHVVQLYYFLERLGLYLTESKNGFPIVFSNIARKGSGFFSSSYGSNVFAKWLVFIS